MKKIILLITLIAIAGCTQKYQPVTEISIPGHGNEIYTFNNDIREALRVHSNDPDEIKQIASQMDRMALVFDGSDQQDNAYFNVVVTDLSAKIPVFYSYEGRLFYFVPYYYLGDQWYNRTNDPIPKPDFDIPVLWLRGPSTGANDTSVNLVNNTVYISGTSYKNLTLAGDKFTLLVFGIDKI
jgi:hypothetical protein